MNRLTTALSRVIDLVDVIVIKFTYEKSELFLIKRKCKILKITRLLLKLNELMINKFQQNNDGI